MKKVFGKIKLNFWQIINMNFGFFGLQYSFGLQQANMSPIYSYLGAQDGNLPFLWLAGPVTGLLIQPIVGVMSDHTLTSWGRRKPYFLIGGVVCSLCLLIMPHSSNLWMAASILWILDAANNITQEPYRAFISDKLQKSQHALGFLTQSAFTGLGQTLSYITPSLLIFFGVNKLARTDHDIPLTTLIAFTIGSIFSIGSILWSVTTTHELPLSEDQKIKIRKARQSFKSYFSEGFHAFREMPRRMKQMIPMGFFCWYAMFIYWIYIPKSLSSSVFNTTSAADSGFRESELLVGKLGAFYNFIAFISAFVLAHLAKKYSPKMIHAICLFLGGAGLLILPSIKDEALVFLPMILLGFCWASMMGMPYVLLASRLPLARTGVYMGIFNIFTVLPMFLQNLTMPLYYNAWLDGDPRNAIRLAGALLILGALSVSLITAYPKNPEE